MEINSNSFLRNCSLPLHVELMIQAAVNLLATKKLQMLDFTTHADLSTYPDHYVIFWEVSRGETNNEVLKECCNCLDKSFTDDAYTASWKIRPLDLRVVTGHFSKL